MLGQRNLLCGLHVHVQPADPGRRVELMARMQPFLPLLLALSTSSPFWMGHATGLMGYRQTAYQEIPRTDCRRCSATRPNTTTTCSA